MDQLLERLWRYLARDEPLTLQIRLFRLICLTVGVLCLGVVLPANCLQNLPLLVNVSDILLGLFAWYCYGQSRRGRNLIVFFFVAMVLMMDPVWYLNAGANGSITYYFFPAVLYPMVLCRGKARWILTASLVLNIAALLVLEYFFPFLTVPFRSSSDRLIDLVSGVFTSCLTMVVVLWVIIANYDWERERISRYARDLAASEKNYREVVENAKSIILRLDAQGRVTFINRFAEDLFGYQRQEIIGRQIVGTLVPAVSLQKEDLAARIDELLAEPHRHAQQETENICRDGRRLRINWTHQPAYNERRELQEILCVGTDITERQQAEEALRLSRQRFLTLVNSIEGIVWEMDLPTRRFIFVSEQAQGLLGYPRDRWLRDNAFWEERIHPDDRPAAVEMFRQELDHHRSHHLEYRMLTAAGQVVWIRHSTTVVVEDGKPVLGCGVLLDITEQKLAARQLDSLHRQLLETSRLSGMAEVASGVLHNVGNVLNSVNVSATLLADGLRQSRIASLVKAARLLQDHPTDLAAFLATDPRGHRLPAFLVNLADHLAHEQAALVAETHLLIKNVEHIKGIVAMQQCYARVSGVLECLPPAVVVEDALQMHAAALQRLGIQVVREYQEVPAVTLEKHKVLQILLNLVRNAEHALREKSGADDKCLRVGIGLKGGDWVQIAVHDNGMGIPPENLTRIFSHGFTTKKDGHGFGLHMGALAAQEMGGSLTASSEGPGKGALFVLELPLHRTPVPAEEGT